MIDKDKVFVNFLPKNSFSINRKLFNEAFNNSVDVNHAFYESEWKSTNS